MLIDHFSEHPDFVAIDNFVFTSRYKEMRTELQKLFMYLPDLLGIGIGKCCFPCFSVAFLYSVGRLMRVVSLHFHSFSV